MYKITINRHGLVWSALEGRKATAVELLRSIRKTLERLDAVNDAPPFTEPPKGVGGYPKLHDVRRWLDSLTTEDAEDVAFAQRVYVTLKNRLGDDGPPAVKEALT